MLTKPIKISEQLNAIGATLQEKFDPMGAKVKECANLRHLWEEVSDMVAEKAGTPRVIVCFGGSQIRPGYYVQREDRTWIVTVMRGHGFNAPGMARKGPAGELPFTDVLEDVRETVRAMLGISEEPVVYRGIKPLPGVATPGQANTFLDAFTVEFTTANDIPDYGLVDPAQVP